MYWKDFEASKDDFVKLLEKFKVLRFEKDILRCILSVS